MDDLAVLGLMTGAVLVLVFLVALWAGYNWGFSVGYKEGSMRRVPTGKFAVKRSDVQKTDR